MYYLLPRFGIFVTKHITYGAWFRAIQTAGKNMDLDPRVVALVQFMARRAAERDFEEARAARATEKEVEPTDTKERS